MNVAIGAEAAQFPEMEYINGIAVAVHAVPIRYRTNLKGHGNAVDFLGFLHSSV